MADNMCVDDQINQNNYTDQNDLSIHSSTCVFTSKLNNCCTNEIEQLKLQPKKLMGMNSEKTMALISEYCSKGLINIVKYMVNNGVPVDYVHEDSEIEKKKPIIFAAENGHLDTVIFLVSKGADPFEHTYVVGASAIHYAAKNGHIQVVSYLMNLLQQTHKIPYNKRMFFINDILCVSARNGFDQLVSIIIDICHLTNKDIDAIQIDYIRNYSPMLYAISYGHLRVVKTLIKHKASVSYNELFIAVRAGHTHIVEYLIKPKHKINVNIPKICNKTSNAWTLLMVAAYHGDLNIIKLLLAKTNIDVSYTNNIGESVLSIAKQQREKNIVEYLDNYLKNNIKDVENRLLHLEIC
jgi:ankyrin repeat protein